MTRDTSWYSIKIIHLLERSLDTSDPLRLVLCLGELAVQSWSTRESMLKWRITSGGMTLYWVEREDFNYVIADAAAGS